MTVEAGFIQEVPPDQDLSGAVQGLKAALRPLLDKELKRLQDEAQYLREVRDGISGGAALETSSTVYVDSFLASALSDYFGGP